MVYLCLLLLIVTCLFFIYRHQIRLFVNRLERAMLSGQPHLPNLNVNYPLRDLKRLASLINQQRNYRNNEVDLLQRQKEDLQQQVTAISHDLRTPLMAIKGYWELYASTDDAVQKEQYLETIKKRLDMLAQLIEDFYALTQLEDYSQNVEELREVDPGKVLMQTSFMFYDDCQRRQLEVRPQIERGTRVRSDARVLGRVYANIFQNILRYGRGQVDVIHASEIPAEIGQWLQKVPNLYLPQSACYTVFTNFVSPQQNFPADCNHLFNRFYKGDLCRNQDIEVSSGLGLYICRLLLENQGFSISAISTDEMPQRLIFIIAYPSTHKFLLPSTVSHH